MVFKIIKRSKTIKSLLFFNVLTLFFFHIILSIHFDHSALDGSRFLNFLNAQKGILVLFALSFFSTFYALKISRKIFILFLVVVFIKSFFVFTQDFDKFILFLIFIFSLLSCGADILIREELASSVYQRRFSESNLVKRSPYPLYGKLEFEKGFALKGHLINWDAFSCSFYVEEMPSRCCGKVLLTFFLDGVVIKEEGEVISQCGDSIGISFLRVPGEKEGVEYRWLDLYNFIQDRGFKPERIKIL